MKAHELAKKLLELPNLPVIVEAECWLCDFEVTGIERCKDYKIPDLSSDDGNKKHYDECILLGVENQLFPFNE